MRRENEMKSIWRNVAAGGAAVAATVALAACGSHSGTSTSTASASASTAGSSQQQFVHAVTQFAGCMRTHGIPVPDPNSQGDITGSAQLQQEYQNTPEGQAALRACQSYLQNAKPQLTAAQTQEFLQAQLAFVRCMRAHGVQLADPQPNGNLNLTGIDKGSPQFRRAANACAAERDHLRSLANAFGK
jgi:hypothetical protein